MFEEMPNHEGVLRYAILHDNQQEALASSCQILADLNVSGGSF